MLYNASIVSEAKLDRSTVMQGAQKVTAGQTICTLQQPDGRVRKLTTPVGGCVLELNTRLEAHPELLLKDPQGTGYICVIFPDTELPDFHNFSSWKLKEKLKSESKYREGMCFSWIEGACKRGSDCKFTHIDLDSIATNTVEVSSAPDADDGSDKGGESKRMKVAAEAVEVAGMQIEGCEPKQEKQAVET